jgi:hypothetical protein
MTMMMAANLVGFVLGIDGTKFFVQQLFGTAEGGDPPCMFYNRLKSFRNVVFGRRLCVSVLCLPPDVRVPVSSRSSYPYSHETEPFAEKTKNGMG